MATRVKRKTLKQKAAAKKATNPNARTTSTGSCSNYISGWCPYVAFKVLAYSSFGSVVADYQNPSDDYHKGYTNYQNSSDD